MKAINYDTEGDILTITFTETAEQSHAGIELSDNIILYYNPETQQPLKLILLSYQGLLQASRQAPILLDGLAQAPRKVQAAVTTVLQRDPLKIFMQLVEVPEKRPPTGRLHDIFTPTTLQTVMAS